MRWAETEHQVRRFILSISPSNVASLGIAHQLGFVRIGEQMDDEDGIEDIYLKDRGTLDDDPIRL
jgi:RimJ/RimL family protein N-acetyltransferase